MEHDYHVQSTQPVQSGSARAMATYITSIDPGETAGVVQAQQSPAGLRIEWAEEVRWDDWRTWADILEFSDLVICENFRIRPSKARHMGGSQMPTIRLIGFLQGWCALAEPPKEFILVEPASKGFYDRKRLKEGGFDHRSQHVRDATSHLFWHLRRSGHPTTAVVQEEQKEQKE